MGLTSELGDVLANNADLIGNVIDLANGGIDRKLSALSAGVDAQLAQSSLLYDNMTPSLNIVGSAGNRTTAVYNNRPFVSVRKFYEKEDLGLHFGYPSCKYYDISEICSNATLPFYIQVSDTGLDINATHIEKQTLEAVLASGVWIESDD